jgi:hypothetical protein
VNKVFMNHHYCLSTYTVYKNKKDSFFYSLVSYLEV